MGLDKDNWLVLIRRLALLLMQSAAKDPVFPRSLDYLSILEKLMDANVFQLSVPERGRSLCVGISIYLVRRGLYWNIAESFRRIPIDAKSTPSIPSLISISTTPFSVFPPATPEYKECLHAFTIDILTLPILPNRLPLPVVSQLAARLPFVSLAQLSIPHIISRLSGSSESRVHLMANLLTFGSQRVSKASSPTLNMYLSFLVALMDSLKPGCMDPPRNSISKRRQSGAATPWLSDSSDTEDEHHAGGAESFSLRLDSKTLFRLQTLYSRSDLEALVHATQRHPDVRQKIFDYFTALWLVWPSKKDKVMTVLNSGSSSIGFGLTKDVWRGWVRSSAIGKEDDPKRAIEKLTAPSLASQWPPFLFMTELYTHNLLTMGDEEFFSSAPGATRAGAGAGNPLTLDEVASLSRQLLNVAFPLYWHEDQTISNDSVPGLRLQWKSVREMATQCLQAIQARDSRRPFVPLNHWLVTSQIDMRPFVEAAVADEGSLDRPSKVSRVLSRRQMASMSPRLGVLNNIPFSIPFSVRVQILRRFIANDASRLGLDDWFNLHRSRPRFQATIRRKQVAKDGFDQLSGLGAALKERISITFVDEWGNEEAGIDGGGVFKEFLTSLTKEAFDTDRGLWLATNRQELYPNPHSYAREAHQLNWYRFIGQVLGKALYEGILVDVGFASFFLGKWLGRQSYLNLDDLRSLDPELYNGLVFLKHYEGKVEDLALNFVVANDEFGVAKSIDLIPNGSNVPVTRENRTQYIYLVANYRLNIQIKKQSEALFEGVADMIDPKWLRMFDQQELQILISGTQEPVDIDDLKRNTVYGGLYDENHAVVQGFWRVVESFDQKQRQSLLRFVTSCSRAPLLGFQELHPHFSIRDAGSDDSRLPTSSTCVNLLKLPQYPNEYVLRSKLLQAITANAGFDLS
ncbi:uncharacterized protein EI90DRAFT_2966715 [Cantharellus anzutake]|uniref:uncharacterized protein n=1 Tax=Cantharellus anzutake TaxID=1750568 RepID=UPI001907ECF6|nr:uncharacterized protein EI90DRAFT_2966715 [Cantharellus anzutake]KAF8339579.1 hypothetical protein EI90DRAFT_2966715 [Cantharellus anzutake]